MTVSFERLIAVVVLLVIALAGTPTKLAANDGLKSERYGLKTKKPVIQVARQTPANLNQNPFRDKTVSASLSGAAIRIDRSTVQESSLALILANPTVNNSTGKMAESRNATDIDATSSASIICQIHPPVMKAEVSTAGTGFHLSMLQLGDSFAQTASEWFGYSMDQLEVAKAAEYEFSRSMTAASGRYLAPISKIVPASQPANKVTTRLASAVIKNIQSGQIEPRTLKSLPANALQRREGGNISIVVLNVQETPDEVDVASRFETDPLEQDLLIDDLFQSGIRSDRGVAKFNPAAIKVPAISIGHRVESEIEFSSAKTLIRSAKAIVKSIIEAVEPILGLPQSRIVPEKIRKQFFHLDNLFWSSSNLKHFWNTCGSHK